MLSARAVCAGVGECQFVGGAHHIQVADIQGGGGAVLPPVRWYVLSGDFTVMLTLWWCTKSQWLLYVNAYCVLCKSQW